MFYSRKVFFMRARKWLAACSLASLWSTAAHPMELRDALALAYSTNPQLLAQRADLRATDEQVPQALSGIRPTLDVNVAEAAAKEQVTGGDTFEDELLAGQFPNAQYGFTVSQPVFRSGRVESAVKEALAKVRAGRHSFAH